MGRGKPEVAEGYTRVANELLEVAALYPWGSTTACRLWFALARYSWGYQRTSVLGSLTWLSSRTALSRRQVVRAADELEACGQLERSRNRGGQKGHSKTRYRLLKYWREWDWGGAGCPELGADGALEHPRGDRGGGAGYSARVAAREEPGPREGALRPVAEVAAGLLTPPVVEREAFTSVPDPTPPAMATTVRPVGSGLALREAASWVMDERGCNVAQAYITVDRMVQAGELEAYLERKRSDGQDPTFAARSDTQDTTSTARSDAEDPTSPQRSDTQDTTSDPAPPDPFDADVVSPTPLPRSVTHAPTPKKTRKILLCSDDGGDLNSDARKENGLERPGEKENGHTTSTEETHQGAPTPDSEDDDHARP